MKIVHRILAAPVLAVVCLVAAGLSAHLAIRSLTTQFENLRNQKLQLSHNVGDLKTRMAVLNSRLYSTIMLMESMDPAKVESAKRHIETETAALEKGFRDLSDPNDPGLAERIAKLPVAMGRYRNKVNQAMTMAEGSPGGGAVMLTAAERSFTEAFAILGALSEKLDADVQTMSVQVLQVSARGSQMILGTTVLAILASLAVALWSSRYVVRRLERAVEISEALAQGDLDVDMPPVEADELGRLLQSLSGTVRRLADSIRAIQTASTSIDNAAAEISSGSLNLSNRTEHAAGSLEITNSAMHEMGQLLAGGGVAAREARALAESASTLAGRGGEVVSEVVTTMRGINDGSRKISDITGVIDSIAFQTNILALNAAVEAARAGDQGRGFAVVASEVRALAHRSATAAREIKALIVDSVSQTERGAKLVGDAGGTMEEIVAAVRRVDLTIGALARMTEQQNASLGGVSQTLSRFDQMTQENAALAEQSAAASESLRRQSSTLTTVVGQFRLPASVDA